YGFLSENAAFARMSSDAGLTWIGPPPEAIEAMGDKINAKAIVAAAGVPVVPGTTGIGLPDEELIAAAVEIGFPVLIKPSAGGGGKGMHRVEDPQDLPGAITAARREARGAFGDDTLLMERWVHQPRHIEVQVFADRHGTVVHLGERECSLQRRHQKIIEESPSPLIDDITRARIGASAVEAARAVGYEGAGTVELIVSAERPDEYFFMEMNTRLQVEHPVTEMITGLDLVEWQLRVAAGEALGPEVVGSTRRGHAIEARVYAEDPDNEFLPSAGTILRWREPVGGHVRVDSGVRSGSVVGTAYDPMLAKVIAWGEDRGIALARLDAALASTVALGVVTNVALMRRLLASPDVIAGRTDTGLVERLLSVAPGSQEVPADVAVALGLRSALVLEPVSRAVDPWEIPGGWRLGEPAEAVWHWRAGGQELEIGVRGRMEGMARPGEVAVRVGEEPAVTASGQLDDGLTADGLLATVGGVTRRYDVAASGAEVWIGREGSAWRFRRLGLAAADAGVGPVEGGPLTSPMPGAVVAVHVGVGDRVEAGQTLVVVEAMKMEHEVRATVDGEVTELAVSAGEQVSLGQVLAVVSPSEPKAGQ
ncbi:MAG: acetyl/propionyl/methylcrotonyl-CoA carboxylase subunit alpha, partial [Acidimicrobiales bacterium]